MEMDWKNKSLKNVKGAFFCLSFAIICDKDLVVMCAHFVFFFIQ